MVPNCGQNNGPHPHGTHLESVAQSLCSKRDAVCSRLQQVIEAGSRCSATDASRVPGPPTKTQRGEIKPFRHRQDLALHTPSTNSPHVDHRADLDEGARKVLWGQHQAGDVVRLTQAHAGGSARAPACCKSPPWQCRCQMPGQAYCGPRTYWIPTARSSPPPRPCTSATTTSVPPAQWVLWRGEPATPASRGAGPGVSTPRTTHPPPARATPAIRQQARCRC